MKVKVKIGDQVHEIEHTEIQLPEQHKLALYRDGAAPEGFVSTDFMNQEVRRRTEGMVKKEALLDDNDFWKQMATKRNIQLGDDGQPVKAKDVDVQKLYQDWTKEHVDPLKTHVDTLTGQNTNLLRGMKRAGLLQAAEKLGIKKQFRVRPDKDTPSAVEAMFENAFEFDAETNDFAVVEKREADKVTFRYGSNPQERRYAGFEDYFGSLRKNDAFKDWFEDNRPGATGLGDTGGHSGGVIRLSESDSRDPGKWQAAEKQAKETGAKIEIIG